MNRFSEIKKNFGFGCMRLPMIDKEVDHEQVKQMVDVFIEQGFNYFDTAHLYIGGKSEHAVRECLTKRHARESYLLANKLTGLCFKTQEEIRPLLDEQLKICGVDYFDFYLMHAQNAEVYKKFTACRAYETAQELKKEGKVRHVGLSFHDKADLLDEILTEHPEIEFVQIQFNYVDYDNVGIQGRLCYEVCLKHNKPIIIMEPVKGGLLVNLPDAAKAVFDELNGGSYASYAIRYTASFEGVIMVLSGMSNLEQLNDNVQTMKDFKPLNEQEFFAIEKVRAILNAEGTIPCTACNYCVDKCPKKISIPNLFACMNAKKTNKDWNTDMYYAIHTKENGKASDCIKCKKCELVCPQGLKVTELLQKVAQSFEKK